MLHAYPTSVIAQQPKPFIVMARLTNAPSCAPTWCPRGIKIFWQHAAIGLEKARSHHGIDLRRPCKKSRVACGIVPCYEGLKQMHVGILIATVNVSWKCRKISPGRGREKPLQGSDCRISHIKERGVWRCLVRPS